MPKILRFTRSPEAGDRYYANNASATETIAADTLVFVPIDIGTDLTIADIEFEVTAAGVGSDSRVGLYDSAAGGMTPNNLLAESALIDTDTTGVKAFTATHAISRGRYWLAHVNQIGTTAATIRTAEFMPFPFVIEVSDATALNENYLTQAAVTGALPDPAVPDGIRAGGPAMAFTIG